MKQTVWYFHQYFKTPEEGGAIRSWHLSQKLAREGIQTKVITAWNKGYYEKRDFFGVEVHYLPVAYESSFSFSRRLISFFLFVQKAIFLVNKWPKPQAVYITSTPLTIGLIGLWLKKTRNISYVLEIRDLWPEVPIAMGILQHKWGIRLAKNLEKWVVLHAERLVVLSEGMAEYYHQHFPKKDLVVIPNFSDNQWLTHNLDKWNTRPTKIIYAGSFGPSNRVGRFIVWLDKLCSYDSEVEIEIHLVGDGPEKQRIKNVPIQSKNLNVIWLDPMNKTELRAVFESCHATAVVFAPVQALDSNSPNKFFDGLAAGTWIISTLDGWSKAVLEDHEAGKWVQCQEQEDYLKEWADVFKNKNYQRVMATNAKQLAVETYDKELILTHWYASFMPLPN